MATLTAKNKMRHYRVIPFTLLLTLAFSGASAQPLDSAPAMPVRGVFGIDEAMLSAQFWIAKLDNPDAIVLDSAAISLQNTRLVRADTSLYDLHEIPANPSRKQVRAWIEGLSEPQTAPLYDIHGKRVSAAALEALRANLDLGAIAPVGSSRVDLQACKLEYSIVSPK